MESIALRKRTGYAYAEDDNTSNRILSDEDQEKVISDLQKEYDNSTTITLWVLRGVIGLSLVLHLKFLFDDTGRHPLAPVLGSSQPLVPLAKLFGLLQVVVTLRTLQLAIPQTVNMLRIPATATFALAAASPLWCVLTRTTDLIQLGWWSAAGLLLLGVQQANIMIKESKKDIAELQGLMYDSKSA
ncbi:hypothetical protein BKA62DRAFT_706717 [Auriculariales sp. MPI-PUGE-AT-0066]|nr:hypothetical protein BKA62DRAFT_706717 [Auriculariales sp. MPI-PUGE-AT-0066]